MKEFDRFIMQTVMFNEGIVPIMDPRFDVNRYLATIPPDEARKLKRKFRKLWRTEVKKNEKSLATLKKPEYSFIKPTYPNGKGTVRGDPRKIKSVKAIKLMCWHRKAMVQRHIMLNKVHPLIRRLKENRENLS